MYQPNADLAIGYLHSFCKEDMYISVNKRSRMCDHLNYIV